MTDQGPTLPTTEPSESMALIVLTVQRDRIQLTARLVLGGTQTATRTWQRVGAHSWKTRDADFIAHEDRLGLELAEFADGLDLPSKIADMLPRQRAAPANAPEMEHA